MSTSGSLLLSVEVLLEWRRNDLRTAGQTAAEADRVVGRLAVPIEYLQQGALIEDGEVEGVEVLLKLSVERDRLALCDGACALLAPVVADVRAQFLGLEEELLQRDTALPGRDEVVPARRRVLLAERVPEHLCDLGRHCRWRQRIRVVLALVHVPDAHQSLVVGEPTDVDPHIARAADAQHLRVLRLEVMNPLQNKILPLVGRIEEELLLWRSRDPELYVRGGAERRRRRGSL